MNRMKVFVCGVITVAALFSLSADHLPAGRLPAIRQWISPASATVLLPGGETFRPADIVSVVSLNGDWHFSGLTGSAEPFSSISVKPETDFHQWKTIPVPKSFYYHPGSRYAEILTNGNLYFRGWYAREFELPKTFGSVILEFDAIGYAAKLFINGKAAGEHHGDFIPFQVDVTELVRPGLNTVMLVVDSDFAYQKKGYRYPRTYGCKWDVASIRGGLWGAVRMKIGPEITVERMLINSGIDGRIDIDAVIRNRSSETLCVTPQLAVHSADALQPSCELSALTPVELPPGDTNYRATTRVQSPRLWSPDDPNLYFATLFGKHGGKIVVARMERFGFREFKVDGTGFTLNGKPFYPAGESFHSNAFGGRGPEENVKAKTDRFVAAHRERGVNMLRTAHMPIAREALESADELGMCVYNEWSFTFINRLDENKFEKTNLAELTRWFYRDSNHPSVVMWSLGNENSFKSDPAVARQLNKQTARMRELDSQHRPICAFSGIADFNNYGREKLDTDIIDLHHYQGITAPWTEWERAFEPIWKEVVDIYGVNGKLEKPLVIWECVGGGWGPHYVKDFRYGDVDLFIKHLTVPFTPTEPHGAGYSGVAGLEPILDAGRGTGYMQNYLSSRLCELFRQDPRIAGFAPWIVFPGIADYARWSQPVMPGLRNNAESKLMYRQLLAPMELMLEAYVANGGDALTDCRLRLELDAGERKIPLTEITLGAVAARQVKAVPCKFSIPELPDLPKAELCVTAFAGDRELGRNGYQVTVHNRAAVLAPFATTERVLLVTPSSRLSAILRQLNIEAELWTKSTDLRKFSCAILPWNAVPGSYDGVRLRRWVEAGGRLLILAQRPGAPDGFPEYQFTVNRTCIAEFVAVSHPVFQGLSQADFDLWAENSYGRVTETTPSPIDSTMLGATGLFLGKRNTGAIAAEAVVGKGRVLLDSTANENLWGHNGGASRYLRNWLAYLTMPDVQYAARPIRRQDQMWRIPERRCFFLNLKPFANRGFADEIDSDHLGGWLDQGKNDFRNMPLGRRTAAGIPFEIINPAWNHDRSCLIVRGGKRPDFPREITGIPVNVKLKTFYFLHTAGWSDSGICGWYRIHYADNTYIDYPLISGINIGDWWDPVTLPEARPGVVVENSMGHQIGTFVTCWKNPHPEKIITRLDVLSLDARQGEQYDFANATEAVPVLIAVTGELVNEEPLVVWSSRNPHHSFSGGSTSPQGAGGSIALENKMLHIRLPKVDGKAIPAVFISAWDRKKYSAGETYNHLTIRFRSKGPGRVDLVLPGENWRETLTYTLDLECSGGQWKVLHSRSQTAK